LKKSDGQLIAERALRTDAENLRKVSPAETIIRGPQKVETIIRGYQHLGPPIRGFKHKDSSAAWATVDSESIDVQAEILQRLERIEVRLEAVERRVLERIADLEWEGKRGRRGGAAK
jgi:hypothetical protein